MAGGIIAQVVSDVGRAAAIQRQRRAGDPQETGLIDLFLVPRAAGPIGVGELRFDAIADARLVIGTDDEGGVIATRGDGLHRPKATVKESDLEGVTGAVVVADVGAVGAVQVKGDVAADVAAVNHVVAPHVVARPSGHMGIGQRAGVGVKVGDVGAVVAVQGQGQMGVEA